MPVDNAPANWAYSSAHEGRTPSLEQVTRDLESGRLPVAMIPRAAEIAGATYKGSLHPCMTPPNLNTLGWKVCHIDPVGLSDRTDLTRIEIDILHDHLRRLLRPSNMIVVPKTHAGLGELPEFVEAFRSEAGKHGY